jgi:hypothetical protein
LYGFSTPEPRFCRNVQACLFPNLIQLPSIFRFVDRAAGTLRK